MKWLRRGDDRQQGAHPLAGVELCRDLNARELRVIESFVQERHFIAGEVIFDEGEVGQALYIVLSGRVAICLPGQHQTPLAELAAGSFFGELGLLDNAPRSAQVRALEDCLLVVLSRSDFDRLMESQARIASCIAMQLARHMGLRLRQMLAASTAARP